MSQAMSEHQCYEFVALDRPLTPKEMAELRAISTRAEITPTRFWNEYHWGDLKADPAQLLASYFDAHLYFANWGTRRFMLRLPAERVDVPRLKPYFISRHANLTRAGKFVILDFWSEDENQDEAEWIGGGRLAALIPIRSLLLQGEQSAAYLAWLSSVQAGEVPGIAREPPVPPGLANLPAPLASLAELLRIDRDLLAAAAEASSVSSVDSHQLGAWVTARPLAEKDHWLLHAAEHPEAALGAMILAAFRKDHAGRATGARRTVATLRTRADLLRAGREAREAAERARAQELAAQARAKHLESLAKRWPSAWAELDKLVGGREYHKAATLAADLRELAQRDEKAAEFAARFEVLRKTHARRRGFFDALKRVEQQPPISILRSGRV
jgi:hypothetical protein